MGESSTNMDTAPPKVSFRSKDLDELLDLIDKLRAQGIGHIIDLPQMIVCGDQSSGKSSVLEAISGIRFPTKDNLCTRFPTELILRRNLESTVSITIVPDASRSEEEKTRLQAFDVGAEALDDFGKVVQDAGTLMGLDQNSKVFSNDVLRVELSGPQMPHLTLVDLPGLFHAGNKNQSADDAGAVKALVHKYMAKSRSIILAVVSAKNDYANQIVTEYARDYDPSGERTLGIVTKPDTLHAGSESEKQFFELAENKDVVLRLGWHVLKNRDFDTKDCSAEERDQAETAFFQKRIWASLSPAQLGIHSLKPRLGRVLRDQILTELPSLTREVESGIKDCGNRLEKLGASRVTKQEQRGHLHQVSQSFSAIVQSAVAGHYSHEYFDTSSATSYPKRIRAVVANLLQEFATWMREHGNTYATVDPKSEGGPLDEETYQDPRTGLELYPIYVSRQSRIKKVAQLLRDTRGQELPGFVKFEIVAALFREQCKPWETIVMSYTERIVDEVRAAVLLALTHTSDQSTKDGILRSIVNPALDDIKSDLYDRVQQTLQQHMTGQPVTFNHYFTDNVQKLRNQHRADFLKPKIQKFFHCVGEGNWSTMIERTFSMSALAAALTQSTEADMEKFACSEALYYMEAYYKVALKFFVDDFSIHAIEQGLLQKLPAIFAPSKVLDLDEEEIADIAGESEESVAERASSSTKLKALKEAIRLLRQLDRGQAKK